MEDGGCLISPRCDGAVIVSLNGSQHASTSTNLPGFTSADKDVDVNSYVKTFRRPGSSTELIVLDESGGEEEEGEVKSGAESEVNIDVLAKDKVGRHKREEDEEDVKEVGVNDVCSSRAASSVDKVKVEDHDSDIEIVSGGQASDSFDSEDSLHAVGGDSEKRCQGLDCPYKKQLRMFRKRYRLVKRELKRRKKSARALQCKSTGVEVKFSDEELAKKYRKVVEDFVSNLVTKEAENHTVQNAESSTASCSTAMLYENFYIDKRAENDQSSCAPFFERRFSDSILYKSNKNDDQTKPENTRPAISCFNCLGNHTMNECKNLRDSQRIAHNRNLFMSRRQTPLNSPRYHVEESRDGKFAPGKLSNALRRAMGLKRDELPLHIYKMRVLGYPPGWLKEAEIHGSGITLYDSEGKAQNADEVSDSGQHGVIHDPSKLIDFPGFNVVPPKGTIDNCRQLGFPPMQERHMKSVVEQFMKVKNASPCKRKRSPDVELIGCSEKRQKVMDMELEECMEVEECKSDGDANGASVSGVQLIVPALSSGTNEVNIDATAAADVTTNDNGSQASATQAVASVVSETSDRGSPSLEDLVSAKQKLISALGGDSTSTTPTAINEGECTPVKNAEFSANSKAVCLGSPAIYQASCFSQLPCANKFAVGISEHMNFENLPDSTGSFEKMRKVLRGVRECLTQPKM